MKSQDICCRLCSGTSEVMINIFDNIGKERNISRKVNSLLHIFVHEEDILPKMLCIVCYGKLENFDKFVNYVHSVQIKLTRRITSLDGESCNNNEAKLLIHSETAQRSIPEKVEAGNNDMAAKVIVDDLDVIEIPDSPGSPGAEEADVNFKTPYINSRTPMKSNLKKRNQKSWNGMTRDFEVQEGNNLFSELRSLQNSLLIKNHPIVGSKLLVLEQPNSKSISNDNIAADSDCNKGCTAKLKLGIKTCNNFFAYQVLKTLHNSKHVQKPDLVNDEVLFSTPFRYDFG